MLEQFPSEVAQDKHYGSFPQRSLQVRVPGEISPYTASRSYINIKPAVKNPVNDPSQTPEGINLQFMDQVVEVGQARMIAATVQRFVKATAGAPVDINTLLATLENEVNLGQSMPVTLTGGDLVAVRKYEVAAALSRLRGLRVA